MWHLYNFKKFFRFFRFRCGKIVAVKRDDIRMVSSYIFSSFLKYILTYGVPYGILYSGGEKRMSKKKKKQKNLIELIIKLLIALGTFMAGLASLIQALK